MAGVLSTTQCFQHGPKNRVRQVSEDYRASSESIGRHATTNLPQSRW